MKHETSKADQKKHRQELIEALESGKYTKTSGRMRREKNNGNIEYCALGLACELSGLGKWEEQGAYINGQSYTYRIKGEFREYGVPMLPSVSVMKYYGFTREEVRTLMLQNDSWQLAFSTIAHEIKKGIRVIK